MLVGESVQIKKLGQPGGIWGSQLPSKCNLHRRKLWGLAEGELEAEGLMAWQLSLEFESSLPGPFMGNTGRE